MIKRFVVPLVVMACAGMALAQNNTTNRQPAKTPAAKAPAPTTRSQPAALKVGDKAPGINVDSWVKGDSIESFESGRVYVVEFWATWCGPCKKSIPHLTELQHNNKNLTVIGVAASEKAASSGSDLRLQNLEQFVKAQGNQMGYTVAFDGRRRMAKEWMAAAARNTIPTAFVVDGDGKITWIGSPLEKPFSDAVEKALKAAETKKQAAEKADKSKQPADGNKSKKDAKKDPKK